MAYENIKAEVLVNDICIAIKEFSELKFTLFDVYEKYNEEKLKENHNPEDLIKLKEIKEKISLKLDELHEVSKIDNYFYIDCSFAIFKEKLENKLKTIDNKSRLLSNLKRFYGKYLFIDSYRFLHNDNEKFNYHQFLNNANIDYQIVQEKKVIFFEEKIRALGFTPDIVRLKIKKGDSKNELSQNKKLLNNTLEKISRKVLYYDSRMRHYNEELKYNKNKGEDREFEINILIEGLKDDVSYYVTKELKKLQKISIETNLYFYDCAFLVYEKNYQRRKYKYIKDKIDVSEADFIMSELKDLLNSKNLRFIIYKSKKYHYHNLINDLNHFYSSICKKREYLEHLLYNLGWDANLNEQTDSIPEHYTFIKNENYKPYYKRFKKNKQPTTAVNSIEETNIKKENKISKEQKESKEGGTHKKIFVSKEGEDVFKRALEYLTAVDGNEIKIGFSAKANAIFRNDIFQKKYLIYDCNLNDFIEYLINEYEIKKTTTKLSDHINHVEKTKEFFDNLGIE